MKNILLAFLIVVTSGCAAKKPMNLPSNVELTAAPGSEVAFYQRTRGPFRKVAFKRVIEYLGKDGSAIRFQYREYTQNTSQGLWVGGLLARPAYTQDFVFDLSEGNKVNVKGQLIEIVSADNMGVKYRLLNEWKGE